LNDVSNAYLQYGAMKVNDLWGWVRQDQY
jgi:hypothetical protein